MKAFQLIDVAKEIYWWFFSTYIKGAYKWAPSQFYENRLNSGFDDKFNTDTLLRANLDTLDIDSENWEHGVYYQASPVYSTRKILKRVNINYPEFEFIDFGSGKGRTLLLASELPFKRVVGVEFSRELHVIAQENIRIYPRKVAQKLESVCQDATLFKLPKGNVVIYFFNPFDDVILEKVISNIAVSLGHDPRKAYIVYHFLPSVDLLTTHGFQLIDQWRHYHIFEWQQELLTTTEPIMDKLE